MTECEAKLWTVNWSTMSHYIFLNLKRHFVWQGSQHKEDFFALSSTDHCEQTGNVLHLHTAHGAPAVTVSFVAVSLLGNVPCGRSWASRPQKHMSYPLGQPSTQIHIEKNYTWLHALHWYSSLTPAFHSWREQVASGWKGKEKSVSEEDNQDFNAHWKVGRDFNKQKTNKQNQFQLQPNCEKYNICTYTYTVLYFI